LRDRQEDGQDPEKLSQQGELFFYRDVQDLSGEGVSGRLDYHGAVLLVISVRAEVS
jgi:hypothetical protein